MADGRSIRVCHLTCAGHTPTDVRIYHREVRSLSKRYPDIHIVASGAGNRFQIGTVNFHTFRGRSWYYNLWATLVLASRLKAHVYHYHDAILSLVILYLKWRHKAAIIYDVHEPTRAAEQTFRRGPRLIGIIKSLLVQAAERVVTGRLAGLVLSSPFFEFDYGRFNTNITYIYNFPDRSLFVPGKKALPEAPPIVVYHGHIAPERGILTMLEAVNVLAKRGVEVLFRLVGGWDPPEFRQALEERIRRWDLADNVEIIDWVEHRDIPALVGSASLGILALGQEPVFQQALPNKPFEYMALGVPFVGVRSQPMAKFAPSPESGLLLENVSGESLATAIEELLAAPERMRAMGESGIRAVRERYNWSAREQELLRFYRHTLGS